MTIFNGNIYGKSPFSIAMFNYQVVPHWITIFRCSRRLGCNEWAATHAMSSWQSLARLVISAGDINWNVVLFQDERTPKIVGSANDDGPKGSDFFDPDHPIHLENPLTDGQRQQMLVYFLMPWDCANENRQNRPNHSPGIDRTGLLWDAKWRLPSGNQTWQWKSPINGVFHRIITYKWSIFHCHVVWSPEGIVQDWFLNKKGTSSA